ncbi:MAG: VOC family protein [Alphaproteobacteria bacterium]
MAIWCGIYALNGSCLRTNDQPKRLAASLRQRPRRGRIVAAGATLLGGGDRSAAKGIMAGTLYRIILFVQDVDRLVGFYGAGLGLTPSEHVPGEWAVLRSAGCELALHRAGEAWRGDAAAEAGENSNAKIVFAVAGPLQSHREALARLGACMGEIRHFAGHPGPLCDGQDPEGNVFQLLQSAG